MIMFSEPSIRPLRRRQPLLRLPFLRDRENATPRPHLITNLGATKGVQVVGGMVFDPQNMCWLKLGPQSSRTEQSDPMDNFNGFDDEEDVSGTSPISTIMQAAPSDVVVAVV